MRLLIFTEFSLSRGEFVCSTCGKSYANKKGVVEHIKYNCNMKLQFLCPYCPKRANRATDLYRHIRGLHKNMEIYAIDLRREYMY